jgi:hypothetical protein
MDVSYTKIPLKTDPAQILAAARMPIRQEKGFSDFLFHSYMRREE